MSIENESDETLLAMKQSFDSMLMGCSLAGLPSPAEIEEQFSQVQTELARRGVSQKATAGWTDWLGKEIGSYRLDYLIEEGFYFYLFHAIEIDTNLEYVVKLAKDAQEFGPQAGAIFNPTKLFGITGDVIRELVPKAQLLLRCEVNRLALRHPQLPVVSVAQDNFYSTAFSAGRTLRDIIKYDIDSGPQVLSAAVDICTAMAELSDNAAFVHHGNLKPENILVTNNGLLFRELGYFGAMEVSNGAIEAEATVTTPQYYPWLDCDDITALGIILWETFVGFNPFAGGLDNDTVAEQSNWASDSLKAMVEMELAMSNPYLAPLLTLSRPSDLLPDLSSEMEVLLLKTLRLRIGTDGKLHESEGYQSFLALREDLSRFLQLTKTE